MCGIAGILTPYPETHDLESRIQSMQKALLHRGPDDAGIFLSPDRCIALAHTRLAILDLTAAGHQPMSTPDRRYWITFNGEIYNFQALRSQLKAQGETFHSHTDTEVILKLYQQLGPECIHHLRGMFAFAIWDEWEKTCFLARDPLGVKPLYYWQSGSTLVFASELRAVLASGFPEKRLSAHGLYGYLTSGSVPEPDTLIAQVYLLEAGHWMQWQSGQVKQRCYWQIPFNSGTAFRVAESQDVARQSLLDSLQHHFVSDVPIGIFLSGGLDSTALLALSRQFQSGPLHTYSIAFEEAEWNEGEAAKKIAHYFNAEHSEAVVTSAVGRSLLPRFLQTLDQPSIDGFNTFCVSQLAHENGAKVVLSGLGGDELFNGYRSFQRVPQMVKWGQQIPFKALVGQGLEQWSQSPQWRRIGDFLQRSPTFSNAYRSFRGVFSDREARAIARQFGVEASGSEFPEAAGSTPEESVSLLELSRYMRNQLLRDSDVMSMAWGLELRVPLVDSMLIEQLATISPAERLAAGKQLLIQAVPELPDWLIDQPKRGFFFPYKTWMQQEWQDLVQDITCPAGIPLHPWYRRWSLFVLQHWWRQLSP